MALFDETRQSYLTEEQIEIARSYKKHYQHYQDDLEILSEWAKKQPHLPPLSHAQLYMFLKAAGHSMEEMKILIDRHFTMRTQYDDLFQGRDVTSKKMQATFDFAEIAMYPLEYLTPEGSRIGLFRLKKFCAKTLDFKLSGQSIVTVIDIEIARSPYEKGIFMIFDMTGFSMEFVAKFNIVTVAHLLYYVQYCGLLIQEVHIINCTPVLAKVMFLLKPFLTEKLNKLLRFHTAAEMDQFYKIVPKHLLPSDYGGTMESVAYYDAQFRQRLIECDQFVTDIEGKNYQTDETKRLNRPKYDPLSVNGSFRKLTID